MKHKITVPLILGFLCALMIPFVLRLPFREAD